MIEPENSSIRRSKVGEQRTNRQTLVITEGPTGGRSQAVVNGLMQAGLDSGVPVLSISLTPHHYQETEHHSAIHREHFIPKGREAAEAALMVTKIRTSIAARHSAAEARRFAQRSL